MTLAARERGFYGVILPTLGAGGKGLRMGGSLAALMSAAIWGFAMQVGAR